MLQDLIANDPEDRQFRNCEAGRYSWREGSGSGKPTPALDRRLTIWRTLLYAGREGRPDTFAIRSGQRLRDREKDTLRLHSRLAALVEKLGKALRHAVRNMAGSKSRPELAR
jgi:hypothetical protein